MPKVYLVNGNGQYRDMFLGMGWQVVNLPQYADLVQFTGGEDVDPSLYGEGAAPQTHFNTRRDITEVFLYHACLSRGQKMAGICRGGQFLHVMSGGKLRQHVEGHAIHGTHDVYITQSGELTGVVPCTSTHHQQMFYDRTKVYAGDLIGVDANGQEEIIYHQHTNSLCFQPHPEFYEGPCRTLYFNLLKSELGLC